MIWIIGSLLTILYSVGMMCILITGGRIDDRMVNNIWTEPNSTIEPRKIEAL